MKRKVSQTEILGGRRGREMGRERVQVQREGTGLSPCELGSARKPEPWRSVHVEASPGVSSSGTMCESREALLLAQTWGTGRHGHSPWQVRAARPESSWKWKNLLLTRG